MGSPRRDKHSHALVFVPTKEERDLIYLTKSLGAREKSLKEKEDKLDKLLIKLEDKLKE